MLRLKNIIVHLYIPSKPHHPFLSAPTNEAGRWRVGLNLLLGVLLDNVPKLPYKFWMKNVKWLIWVSLTVLNIWNEQVVIWLLVPLRKKKINTIRYRAPHCEKEAGQPPGGGGATSTLREQEGEWGASRLRLRLTG